MRPLDRLPSIRAKLGSTIVFAVAMTLAGSYFLIGYALRDRPRDTQALELLATARKAENGKLGAPPADTMIVTRAPDGTRTVTGTRFEVTPPVFTDGAPHWGVVGSDAYAVIPTADGGTIAVLQPAPGRGFPGRISATLGFLRSVAWQLLAAGAVSAAIALVLARFMARGMTKPLRDMAAAARRMETGDYSVRVHTRSRDEVGQLAEAFNKMSAELQQLEQLRRDLVANVSHELKTPIAALRAHLENLLDGIERPEPETLQIMLAQSERLGRLVEQLLELSRLESGELPLEREPVPLEPLVSQVLSEIDVARSGRGVTIASDLPEDLPPVLADRERIHQVLFNLLDNAVRFTPAGGRVEVSASSDNGNCEIRVKDTGVGIAPEHMPRLFERFYRVDPARSQKDGGTGIGLAIARSVVEAHGGHIRAESQVGRGTVFTFDLPVASGAQAPTRRTA